MELPTAEIKKEEREGWRKGMRDGGRVGGTEGRKERKKIKKTNLQIYSIFYLLPCYFNEAIIRVK